MISKKTAIKIVKFISYVIYYSGIYSVLNLIFKRNGIYIMFYHRLGDKTKAGFDAGFTVDVNSFEKQVRYFKSHYKIISMDEVLQILNSGKKSDGKYLALTFDDGYLDNFEYGYEIFLKYELKPTIYLTSNVVENQTYLWTDLVIKMISLYKKEKVYLNILEKKFTFKTKTAKQKKFLCEFLISHLKGLKEDEKRKFIELLKKILEFNEPDKCTLMLDWNKIRDMSRKGIVFGGHTLTHPIMNKISFWDIYPELFDSKLMIESNINKKVLHFAYPNGKKFDFNENVKNETVKHYKTAVTTIGGINDAGGDFYELKRIGLSYNMGLEELKVKILYMQMKQSFIEAIWYKKGERNEYSVG